jgi:AcrR family transcriptional regulator
MPEARTGDNASTRERIKAVAAELYVLNGHDGFSFGDIASVIGTTRANIHHHFGNKRQLMDELIADFASNAEARIRRFWMEGDIAFHERMELQLADLMTFYDRFNHRHGDRNMWSPLSRLRHDLGGLGAPAERALEQVNRTYDASLRHAVRQAVSRGELPADTREDQLVRLLRVMLLACPPMTQDRGSFDEVAKLFAAVADIIGAGRRSGEVPKG